MADEQATARAMRSAGIRATSTIREMVREARRAGVRGQDGALHRAARALKERAGARVEPSVGEPGWCTRAQAAEHLGITVKRVDQLRALGRLVWWRHTATGHVWVTRASVAAEAARRGDGG